MKEFKSTYDGNCKALGVEPLAILTTLDNEILFRKVTIGCTSSSVTVGLLSGRCPRFDGATWGGGPRSDQGDQRVPYAVPLHNTTVLLAC